MKFYENQLFHIYNQGNNKRAIFFSDENYHFFLWKMRAYLLPFGDLLAYSLMTTHFHWQFYVRKVQIQRKILREHLDKVEFQRRVHKYGSKAQVVNRDWTRIANGNEFISLNSAIGDMQASYTRAINKEMNWTGSLLRQKCKAKDGWIDEFITLRKPDGKLDYRFLPGTDYAYQCFCYIHDNAKKAGIVENNIDYTWSSAKDYAGLRKGNLCNLELGRQLMDYL